MRADPRRLTAARGCLVLLSLLLAASLAVRAYAYGRPSNSGGPSAPEAAPPPIDLGAGVALARARAGRHHILVGSCADPALVTFAWANPTGSDPALADVPKPGERVSYIYHGWNLGRRFATVGLNAVYFARMAQARLTTGRKPVSDDIAVKIVVPAGCDASPADVLKTFRKQVIATNRSTGAP